MLALTPLIVTLNAIDYAGGVHSARKKDIVLRIAAIGIYCHTNIILL